MGGIRVHLIVEGQVQRVWFRDSTREKAQILGVKGWVKNRQDGSVEIIAEGPKQNVRELIEWCHGGPPNAVVTKITESPEEFMDEFDSFDIVF